MQENQLYDPREDSYLLAEAVKHYAKGKTIDIGTGSGIQAFTAANNKEVTSVLAVDINPDALEYAKKHNPHPILTYAQSDLFSNVEGTFDMSASEASDHAQKNQEVFSAPKTEFSRAQKHPVFDTIIFNPPYLPDDPNVKDIALDGGEHGYELPVRFLKEARRFLKPDGQILFLFSSLTHKDVIDKTLIENSYTYEEVGKQKLDFEILYVYKINKVESLVPDVKDLEFFSKGKRGLIYIGKHDGKKVAVKIKNPSSESPARIIIEGQNQKRVNKYGIGPKMISYDENYSMYEFVEGTLFPEFAETASNDDIKKIILDVFNQMRTLDNVKISKEEMTNPYKHIIVTEDMSAVLIDFERSNYEPTPNNVTQFCQYLISGSFGMKLREKGFNIDKEKMMALAKEYKKLYSEEIYKEILAQIK